MKNLTIPLLLIIALLSMYVTSAENSKARMYVQKSEDYIRSALEIQKKSMTQTHCALTFISPIVDQRNIQSPLKVEVIVDNSKDNCRWGVFEAQAGLVSLVTDTNISVGKNILETTGNWMTQDPVTYTSTITYSLNGYTGPLKLKFIDENPKGDGQHQTAFYTIYPN